MYATPILSGSSSNPCTFPFLQHWTQSPIYLQVCKLKNELASIPVATLHVNRDAEDDFVQHKLLVKRLRQFPIWHLKTILKGSYSDQMLGALPEFLSFLNRCTLKLGEMDAMAKGAISQAHLYTKHPHLRFLDLCGGPGGFAEYLLLVHKWECKGLGVTLVGNLDYQLKRFHSNVVSGSFCSITHESKNQRMTGDLFHPETVKTIAQYVAILKKVDLVVADGAMDMNGEENKQEAHSLPLQLQEAKIAFTHLEQGGSFHLKLFDISKDESFAFLVMLKSAFTRITLMKPPLSRAANSERYLLCQGFHLKDFSCERWTFLKSVVENPKLALDLIPPSDFVTLREHVQNHLFTTWNAQAQALQRLVSACENHSQLRTERDVTSRMDLETCIRNIRSQWQKWNLGWFHGLLKETPFGGYPPSTLSGPGPVPLFDNWTQLHHDTRYLSLLNHLPLNPNERIIYISGKRLFDTNLQTIDETAYPAFKKFTSYPTNTLLVVTMEGKVTKIIAVPHYPILFQETSQQQGKVWNAFMENLKWWAPVSSSVGSTSTTPPSTALSQSLETNP